MQNISEFFGLSCLDLSQDFASALKRQLCPFTKKICIKVRKSNPKTKIGTCTVNYQNKDIIICPFRLLEHNQIFIDCLHLLTCHEPGNTLYIVPEVQIPGGNVDYFLVSAQNNKVRDFLGIELQTMDTTGTVWPTRQLFLNGIGIPVPKKDLTNPKAFGMNWKMTLKTILVQMHHKSRTFEHLNKHLVLIVQTPLFQHMLQDFDFNSIVGVRTGDPIHIHSYLLNSFDNHFSLSLDTRISTDSTGMARCLGLNAEPEVDLQVLIQTLERKINEGNRLTIGLTQ